MTTIRHFAENAKTARERRILNAMADNAEAQKAAEAAMPEWAKACAIDTRVPVSAKVEHDGLKVESWMSKKGREMHRVHWADGTETQFQNSLDKNYVQWDR